ncbi:MAG: ThiF family adenylyltransferase [Candidatus Micrarchaeota archaeon]
MKTVAVVGLGCVGSRTAARLKGKTNLLLIDFDSVRVENLGCQNYTAKDNGRKKAVATSEKTGGKAIVKRLTGKNAAGILENAGVIADCTDNWTARKTIDDYCAKTGKKWIYAGALRTQAMVATIGKAGNFAKWAGKKPEREVSCHVAGISVKACKWAAETQAAEVKRLLAGRKPSLEGKIAFYDAATGEKTLLKKAG